MIDNSMIDNLQKTIGYVFKDKELVQRAFTHSSYAHLKNIRSYERLEFLGDSVLGFVISAEIFGIYRDSQEGDLTKMREKIVEGKNLAEMSKKLHLDKYVRVVKNLEINDNIMADICESLIAAIYIDGGYDAARNFIVKEFTEQIEQVSQRQLKDYKTIVNEKFARKGIEYRATETSAGEFEVTLFVDDVQVANACAKSKESAEKACAEKFVNTL